MDNEQASASAPDGRREYLKPQLERQPDWDIATGQVIGPSQPLD